MNGLFDFFSNSLEFLQGIWDVLSGGLTAVYNSFQHIYETFTSVVQLVTQPVDVLPSVASGFVMLTFFLGVVLFVVRLVLGGGSNG